jgi:hypothetical protein
VTVVRAFRPHVIVAVFTGTPRDGHGHHQVSGQLAREAYELAGDTARMPTHINATRLPAWSPLKFYRSSRFAPDSATLRFNVGEYDPVLGRSYAEIAGESRSQHKSQGFGALQRRGVVWDYLRREATRVNAGQEPRAERSMFDGIDTSLALLKREAGRAEYDAAIDALGRAIVAAQRSPSWVDPASALQPLADVLRLTFARSQSNNAARPVDSTGRPIDMPLALRQAYDRIARRAQRALTIASGVMVDAEVDREVVARGDSTRLSITVYNRGRLPVRAAVDPGLGCNRVSVRGPDGRLQGRTVPVVPDSIGTIAPDSARVWRGWVCDGVDGAPRWLAEGRIGDMFRARASSFPEDDAGSRVTLGFAVDAGESRTATFAHEAPVVRRIADPVRGDVSRPVVFVPAISARLDRSTELAPANAPLDRTVRVHLRSAATVAREVAVILRPPSGLSVDSARRTVTLQPGGSASLAFRVRGRLRPGEHSMAVYAESSGQRYDVGYTTVDYEHIRPRRLFAPATTRIVAADVIVPPALAVAYLPGVSDNVAPAIEQLGIPVTLVDAATLPNLDPTRVPVLVVGPRAYEANDTLRANAAAVLEFARRGGTVVVQYGQHEMMEPGIMPYPVALERRADRVTEEDAPVRVIDPASPVLTSPNRITERDFAGWVQERALYMPRTFDARYRAPLSMNDPGEPPNQGAILVAPVGSGTYVYTTISFFRQLPAGHPGAARLFVNLLAAGRRPTAP